MTYTFVNISAIKFSINGRELFKTFIPFYVNDNMIKILNIYDSSCPLVGNTLVTDFEVDGLRFANATDLSNAIHDVIFSRNVEGEVNNTQIEINRLAIIELQNDKADVDHNHNDLYYTKIEIDNKINSIVNTSDLLNSGEVDGNKINFRDGDGVIVFSVDADAFLAQGTSVDFDNGVLKLKNSSGVTISTTNIEAKESYYDVFKFVSGIEDDLTDLVLTAPFVLAKSVSGLYFFVSKADSKENFIKSRIYNRNLDSFFDLGFPTIETLEFKAWPLTIPVEAFINNNLYKFDFWIQKASNKTAGSGITDNLDNFDWGGDLNSSVVINMGDPDDTLHEVDFTFIGATKPTVNIQPNRFTFNTLDSLFQLDGLSFKIKPPGVTPQIGKALGFVGDDGKIGIVEIKGTDLSYLPSSRTLVSSTGDNVIIPLVSDTEPGLALPGSDKILVKTTRIGGNSINLASSISRQLLPGPGSPFQVYDVISVAITKNLTTGFSANPTCFLRLGNKDVVSPITNLDLNIVGRKYVKPTLVPVSGVSDEFPSVFNSILSFEVDNSVSGGAGEITIDVVYRVVN